MPQVKMVDEVFFVFPQGLSFVDDLKKPLHPVKPPSGREGDRASAVEGECESIKVFRNAKNYRFPVKLFVSVSPLFSFDLGSRKRRKAGRCLASQCKSCKKENGERRFRALRSATKDAVLRVSLRETLETATF